MADDEVLKLAKFTIDVASPEAFRFLSTEFLQLWPWVKSTQAR